MPLVAGLWLGFPSWQVAFLVVDFNAEELKQRIPGLVTYLLMALNVVFVLLAVSFSLWLTVRLFPDSRVVQATRSLAGYGAVGWLHSEKLFYPLVLLAGQIAFWIGVRVLCGAAVRRLEGWEES